MAFRSRVMFTARLFFEPWRCLMRIPGAPVRYFASPEMSGNGSDSGFVGTFDRDPEKQDPITELAASGGEHGGWEAGRVSQFRVDANVFRAGCCELMAGHLLS